MFKDLHLECSILTFGHDFYVYTRPGDGTTYFGTLKALRAVHKQLHGKPRCCR